MSGASDRVCRPPWEGDSVCLTQPGPVPLVGLYEAHTQKFDDPTNLVLPLERRIGWYPAILGLGYARDAVGATVVPLHATKIEFAAINEPSGPGAAFTVNTDAPKYVLVDSLIRFFSILSDGERSVVPPYIGGGQQPYGLVITSAGAGGLLGQLRYYWRWMPRDSKYPGMTGCL